MKRWQAFNAVCDCLRAGLVDHAALPEHRQIPWKGLIAASSYHYVTPALAWCWQQNKNLTDDVRDYLDAVLRLNTKRNELMLDTLRRVVVALHAIDVEPILLKGGAHLVEGLYPAPGLRVMGDLDVLIPEDRGAAAVEALKSIGFSYAAFGVSEEHHHLPMLLDRDSNAGVELHVRLGEHETEAVIPAAWMRQNTRAVAFRGVQVRLPEVTRQVGHNVVHSQINHRHYVDKRIELRQLLDLAMMRIRHESEIDWAGLDRRFSDAGRGHVLATYLLFAERLFGQPVPRLSHAPRADAVAELRRVIEPGLRRWAYLAKIWSEYAAARRQDPFGVLKLLTPGTWCRGIRLITNGAKLKW